jgi:hypothetical protein
MDAWYGGKMNRPLLPRMLFEAAVAGVEGAVRGIEGVVAGVKDAVAGVEDTVTGVHGGEGRRRGG